MAVFYPSTLCQTENPEGEYGARLRDGTDPESLKGEAGVLQEAVQPERVSLWLRPPGSASREAEKP